MLDAHISMPAWGGQDIDREKTVFVWPSGTARAEKTDMINVTFTPGMTEKQVKTLLTREFDLDWWDTAPSHSTQCSTSCFGV